MSFDEVCWRGAPRRQCNVVQSSPGLRASEGYIPIILEEGPVASIKFGNQFLQIRRGFQNTSKGIRYRIEHPIRRIKLPVLQTQHELRDNFSLKEEDVARRAVVRAV